MTNSKHTHSDGRDEMRNTITITANPAGLGAPAYYLNNELGQTNADAAAAAIARKNSLHVCGGPQHEHKTPEGDHVYRATLGWPSRGGGFSVSGEIWFSIT